MDINIPSREDFDYFYVKPPSFWLAWSLIYILGILFFVSSFFPELHNNNDQCNDVIYWAYAQAIFLWIIPIYFEIINYFESKAYHLKFNSYSFWVFLDNNGNRLLLAVSFIINLGLTFSYNKQQQCMMLTLVTGMYTLMYWMLFACASYVYIKMFCEGQADGPDFQEMFRSI